MERESIYEGKLFRLEALRWAKPDGRELRRDVVRHPGAVVILPLLDDARVVLIRNERRAVGLTLWELPAGTLEDGEDPSDTAGRELREETGYKADRLRRLGELYTSPGFLDEKLHLFLATGLTHVGQQLEDEESIEVHETPIDEALQMIDDGRIVDGKSIATLLMWTRRRDEFQE